MRVRPIQPGDFEPWLKMRNALWPGHSGDELRADAERMMAGDPRPYIKMQTFVAEDDQGLCGFLEASLRGNAEGCDSSPVGYIEGWYVSAEMRGEGVGKALVKAAENWARELGCTEMASDAHADNESSRKAHRALGYREKKPVVHFHKKL